MRFETITEAIPEEIKIDDEEENVEKNLEDEEKKIVDYSVELYEKREYGENYYIHGTNAKALEGMIQSDYQVIPGKEIALTFTGESGGESALNKNIVSVARFNNKGLFSVDRYCKQASKDFALTSENITDKIEKNTRHLNIMENTDYKKGSIFHNGHLTEINNKKRLLKAKEYFFNLSEEEINNHNFLSQIPVIVLGKQLESNEIYVRSDISEEVGLSRLNFQIIAVQSEYVKYITEMVNNPNIKVVNINNLHIIEKNYTQIKKIYEQNINELKKNYSDGNIGNALDFFNKNFPQDTLWNYNPKTGEKMKNIKEKIKYFLCFNKYHRYSFGYIDK